MEELLNIVDNLVLEILEIVSEQSDASSRLGYRGFVTGPNRLENVTLEQPNDTIDVGL